MRRSWPYATTATTIMFLATDVVGWFVTWQSGADKAFAYFLVTLYPAIAALCMMAVCLFAPAVFAGARFKMPHPFTLPTLYLLIVYAIESLVRFSESGIRRIEGLARYDLLWLDVWVLVEAWVALVVVLLLVGVFSAERKDVN